MSDDPAGVQRAALQALAEDTPAVLIVAEPGAGRAALASAIASALDEDYAVMPLVAAHALRTVPFGLLMPALQPLQTQDLIRDGRVAVLRALWSVVETTAKASGRPVLVVAEDMHDADEESGAVLAEGVYSGWVRLLATARTRPGMPRALLHLWSDGLAERLELGPRDLEGSRALAEQLVGGRLSRTAAAVLHHMSGGSPERLPLLLREALERKALTEQHGIWVLATDLASSGEALGEYIGAELDGMPAPHREALRLLAHAGPVPEGSVGDLIDESVLIELGEWGWLGESGSGVLQIGGALTADAIRRLTSVPRKLVLFEKLESVREQKGEEWRADRPNALALLALALDCGAQVPDERLVAGAVLAVRRFENALALRCTRLVRDEGQRSLLRGARARALFNTGDYTAALTSVLVGPLHRTEEEDILAGTLMLYHLRCVMGTPQAVLADAEELEERAGGLPEETVRARVLRRVRLLRALAAAGAGDFETALRLSEERRSEERLSEERLSEQRQGADDDVPEPAVEGALWEVLAAERDLASGRFSTAASRCAGLIRQRIEADEHFPLEEHILVRHLGASVHAGSWPVIEEAVEFYGTGRSRPVVVFGPGLYSAQAYGLIRRERYDEALQILPDAVEGLRMNDPHLLLGLTLALAAYACAAAGRAEEAEEWLAAADAAAETGGLITIGLARLHRIGARVLLGRPAALSALGELVADLAASGFTGIEMAGRIVGLELDLAEEDATEAGLGPASAAETADRCEGPLAAAWGAWARAACTRSPQDFMAAGELLEGADLTKRAHTAFARAAEGFDEAGDRTGGRRAGIAARRCEPSDGAAPDGELEAILASFELTPREQDTVGLALAGLSDRQIAEELHLSVRTVEGHLYRSYGKLGIASRSELRSAIED